MFLDREMTPELTEELLKQHIIIASSEHAVYQKAKQINGSSLLRLETASVEAIRLEHILGKWKGWDTSWSVLKGKRVLDLASGSGYSRDELNNIWYPQFSRLCAVNGANVVAIDILPQRGFDQELFAWAQADLIEIVLNGGLSSLPVLQERKFDLINSANFVGINYYPGLPQQCARRNIRIDKFESLLADQASAFLEEGGIMSLDTRDKQFNQIFYRRAGEEIIPKVDLF